MSNTTIFVRRFLAALTFVLAFDYLCFAFIQAEPNPFAWPLGIRAAAVWALTILGGVFATIFGVAEIK